MLKTEKKGVLLVQDKEKNLVAIVHKDDATRKNLLYICTEATLDQFAQIIEGTIVEEKINVEKPV